MSNNKWYPWKKAYNNKLCPNSKMNIRTPYKKHPLPMIAYDPQYQLSHYSYDKDS